MNSSEPSKRLATRPALLRQLHALGVEEGAVLLVHSSFRAVRPVEGGPAGLVAALREALGPSGTLVMPCWPGDDEQPFCPETTASDDALGAVPQAFWRLPGVRRSGHFFAFAAAGPKAGAILADPLPLPPHRRESPVGRVWEHDGQVLLLGVDHDANTTLHLAECLAGVPYGVPKLCTFLQDGRLQRIRYLENDHCCERLRLAGEWLRERGLVRKGSVGHAPATLVRSRDIVSVALEKLAADPLVFLHSAGSGCEECAMARASVRS